MKSPIRTLSCLCCSVLSPLLAHAEYVPTSEYLEHPELNVELVVSTANFWARAKDYVNGGYYNYVDDAGKPVIPNESWWNTEQCGQRFDFHLRTVFGQSRMAYAFSKAFMLTGDRSYLEHAEYALDFMYRTGWDPDNGGWFFTTNERGELAPWQPCDAWNPNQWKWTFNQLYPLLGMAALSEALLDASHTTRGHRPASSRHWRWLAAGSELLESKLWDARPGYLGYYENADLDWNNLRGKGFTGAADAITTHAESLYLQTHDPARKQRLLELADILAQRLTPTIALDETLFGFVEAFDNQWGIDRTNGSGFVGHLMKAAWCLARAYMIEPRSRYRRAAMAIIREVWENGGYDHEHGGIFQDFDWRTGAITPGKNFWNVEQGFTGGISNYYIADGAADRDLNLQIADESLQFFMTHMRDPVDGVPYTSTLNDGTPADTSKGNLWKAGYHDSEMGYLAYLYGNLYYKGQDVSLHYYFEPREEWHSIKLTPLAIEDGALFISDVTLDGKAFRHYDSDERELAIPPHAGGVFRVTFSPTRRRECRSSVSAD
jgi:mannose/cellobiose epimerase-like protein (N-acyl-D-glucosamine 2-epimerase family)